MAPNSGIQLLLSPAELSFLHTSLALNPPIRPDGRSPTQFRPLIAEKDVVPSANGSARVCFADGTEAIVGIKAQVEKSDARYNAETLQDVAMDMDAENDDPGASSNGQGQPEWVEMAIDIPGCRDDDALPILLSNLLMEALLVGGEVQKRLWINRRFHWKLYIDVCLSIRRHTLLTRPDSPPLRPSVISTSTPLYRDAFGTAYHTVAKADLGRRPRPSVR
jgi:exosome complex component RRP42